MRMLFAYDSEEAGGQWLSDFIRQHEPVVAILSHYVSPNPAIDSSEFRFGNTGEIVVIDIAHANDEFIDKSFDEMVYISGQIGGVMPADVFDGFSAPDVSFIPVARKARGIKREFLKKKRASSMAVSFFWGDVEFQTGRDDRELISGKSAALLILLARGRVEMDSRFYIDDKGDQRWFFWRAKDNSLHFFTVEEFLDFAVRVSEHVEDKHKESWSKQ